MLGILNEIGIIRGAFAMRDSSYLFVHLNKCPSQNMAPNMNMNLFNVPIIFVEYMYTHELRVSRSSGEECSIRGRDSELRLAGTFRGRGPLA